MSRLLAGSIVVLLFAPSPARAQVYPERVIVKAKDRVVAAATAYQRRTRDDSREEQTERTTKTFRLGAQGMLMLGNISGDITVTRGSGSETTVEIVKTAHGRDVNDARALLQLVTVDAVERNGRADVRARYAGGDELRRNNRRSINVDVNYTVTAPADAHVSVETISGDVRITGIKGVSSAKTISGSVEIADANVDGVLEASSVSGDVRLRHVTATRIQSGSVSGNLDLDDIHSDRVTASTTSGNIVFGGALARNGRYELKGFSGDVRVRLVGTTGFEVDASTFNGQIRSDDFPITMRGRTNGRHLSGAWGDGSAVLDLQTFSGSIVITRQR